MWKNLTGLQQAQLLLNTFDMNGNTESQTPWLIIFTCH